MEAQFHTFSLMTKLWTNSIYYMVYAWLMLQKICFFLFFCSGPECGCEAFVYLLASKDSDALVVHSLNNEHNHDVFPV